MSSVVEQDFNEDFFVDLSFLTYILCIDKPETSEARCRILFFSEKINIGQILCIFHTSARSLSNVFWATSVTSMDIPLISNCSIFRFTRTEVNVSSAILFVQFWLYNLGRSRCRRTFYFKTRPRIEYLWLSKNVVCYFGT